MSEVTANKQLIIGLPETGKTTFLAALWHVVTSEEIPESLRLAHLYGRVEYLNEIAGKWASSVAIDRTVPGTEELDIRMRLRLPSAEDVTELVFPDMSGEAFRHLWEDRQWENHYDEVARASTGALLFIHPDRVHHPARIAELAVPTEAVSVGDEDSDSTRSDWHPSQAGTAVKLVEFLQLFTEQTDSYHVNRVAIIVSAWDTVEEIISPDEWIAKRLPLLDQYLKSNDDRLAYRIYGLSAQGGDLSNQNESKLSVLIAPSTISLPLSDGPPTFEWSYALARSVSIRPSPARIFRWTS
jgi:hypothetical protein